jgi:hypothetical protein
MPMGPIERAYFLASTGRYENFTAVKKALRREFPVDRELVGRALSVDITRLCHERRRALTAKQEAACGARAVEVS